MDLLRLFSLEVLDTRIKSDSPEKTAQIKNNAPSSRWNTAEFYFYYLVFIVTVPSMFRQAMAGSNENSINYSKFEHKLDQGWIFGRKVDNSDAQYAGFRNKLPVLAGVMIGHYVLRRLSRSIKIPRRAFDIGFGSVYLIVLHGTSFLKIISIYGISFAISRTCSKSVGMGLTWAFSILILFLNEWFEGYKFANTLPILAVLDGYTGLLPRWDVSFNFSILRMISFNYDYYQALESPTNIEKKYRDEKEITERDRINIGPPVEDFGFANYIAYLIYTPLYIAGPILTFNDYMYQTRHTLATIRWQRILPYGLRMLVCILTMEYLLHYMYVVALSSERAWDGLTPMQISMICYFNLTTIWLKLLIPWRLFRFWALLDGVDAPENMLRCMSNNYSASAFWRAWHRSYNRWITRHMYIPLGGASSPIRNMLLVFTFVAFWHDIQLRLLAWGWLITLFVVPEVVAKLVFPPKRWASSPVYRHMCALGAVFNIYMLMVANLVGFAIGLDGVRDMFQDLFRSWAGIPYFLLTSGALFVGVQIMFEVRGAEERRGIFIRC
ncbi:MBOAT, membrane-bound O-acyltransferase family-domain-containing protein [Lipomyces oligophaga]|uniref:MBOAT, membrane-bound O-acyltransferase family-domain-containing protein n=1 Tax=Lipomyces oligophaga TaxID=45792 RepID=UPI0034CFA5CE